MKALLAILGPTAKPLLELRRSRSPIAEAPRDLRRGLRGGPRARAAERHAGRCSRPARTHWPFPIPLVKDDAGWRFDTAAGDEEIVARRIGRNELSTIQACLAFVDAQREYYERNPEKAALLHYARKFVEHATASATASTTRRRTAKTPSPLGALFAEREGRGLQDGQKGKPMPYHGYYYRMLDGQGPHATGGAYDYLAKGKLLGGFALVAYPGELGQLGRDDLPRQPGRRRLPEGPRPEDRGDRAGDEALRSRRHLAARAGSGPGYGERDGGSGRDAVKRVHTSRRSRPRCSPGSSGAPLARAADPAPLVERRRREAVDRRVRRGDDEGRSARLRRARRAHRRLRQRRHALGRAADVLPARLRARPGAGARAAESDVEDDGALREHPRQDIPSALAGGEKAIADIVMATHAGMTTDAFAKIVAEWFATAKHPRFDRPYTECVYQPMLELLAYLRANGFKTFIVSGGGIEFIRVLRAIASTASRPSRWSARTIETRFELQRRRSRADARGEDRLHRRRPRQAGRHREVHRPPSDLRVRQLRRRSADARVDRRRSGKRFLGLVHHTDAEREWAYDHPSAVGQLDTALAEANAKGWSVVDMKKDWKRVFPFESAPAATTAPAP